MTDRGDLEQRRARLTAEQRARLDRRLRGAAGGAELRRRTERATAQLSFAQQRLWLLEQLAPNTAAFNLPHAVRLRGSLDAAALERALGALIARHESLRTTFAVEDGQPIQRIAPSLAVPLQRLALGSASELAGRLAPFAARPFDLERGPLIRMLLVELGPADHVLAMVMHHLVTDGWSTALLSRDLMALYRGAPLRPLAVQYADFAIWQRRQLAAAGDGELVYWKQQLAGAPRVLELPVDRPRTGGVRRAGTRSRVLGSSTRAGLLALAHAGGTTLFTVLVAGVAELLHRLTGADDLLLGTPTANRTSPAIEEVVGCFVNTLVLRIDLAGDPGFRALVHRVRSVVHAALAHQLLPFDQLVEALRPERRLDATPLFQVLIALQSALPAASLAELAVEELAVGPAAVQFDLTFAFADERDGLTARVDFDASLFDDASIEAVLDQLAVLLDAALASPEQPLSTISALAAPAAAALDAAQPAASPVPAEPLWRAIAAHAPDRVAVRCGDRALSYGELITASSRVAAALQAAGVGPDQITAVFVERDVALPIALLATLQAGGAFAPIDPALPAGRIDALLGELRPRAILTHERLCSRVAGARAPILLLEQIAATPAAAPREIDADPDHLAYVICTSGSTGRPKAVLSTRGGLANQLHWKNRAIRLGAADRFLHGVPISFDPAVWGVLGPLVAGATIELTTGADHGDLRAFIERARASAATVLDVAAPTLGALVREPDFASLGRHVRHVFCGGGVLSPALKQRFFELLPGATLFNQYGPTEATIDATSMPCTPRAEARVPIGYPVANTQIHILDAALARVPIGAIGELYIGGAGVGRGYLGDAALTAARFTPDPFSRRAGARMYRTGDRARRRADGAIEFLGRVDAQLKIRGQRIEPAEIEAALLDQPGVVEAAAAISRGAGEPSLVAYVVTAPDQAGAAELRAALRARLPDAMVPSYFVRLDRLPRLPSGKLDARALPEPDHRALPRSAPHVEPRSAVERALCALWCRTLRVERVGIDDDFFELGGHSLLAAQLARAVAEELGVSIELRRLFERPTIRGLAPSIESAPSERAPFEIVPGRRAAPLAYGQERLVRQQLRAPSAASLNVPLALRLAGPLDVELFRGALDALVARHAVLRAVVRSGETGLIQELAAAPAVALLDLAPEVVAAHRLARAQQPFQLDREPPLRLDLVRCGEAEHVLLATTHRHVYDGASLGVLWRDLGSLYAGRLRDRAFELPPLGASFFDVATWQRSAFESTALEARIEQWRPRWPRAPHVLRLLDGPRLIAGAAHEPAAIVERTLDPDAVAAVGRCQAALRISRAALIIAAITAGFERGPFALTSENRTLPHSADLVGRFVNLLPIDIPAARAPQLAELARQIHDRIADALAAEVPFERLARAFEGDLELAPADRLPVLLNVIDVRDPPRELAGIRMAPLPPLELAADFALACNVLLGSGIAIHAVYAPSRIDRAAVEALLDAAIARLRAVPA